MRKNRQDDQQMGMSSRAGLLLVIVAVVTLEATSIIQFYFAQKSIKEEASMKAKSELKSAENSIMDVVDQAEAAVRNSIWVAEWCLENPDSLMRVPQRVVSDNPVVVGSTLALVPNYDKRQPLCAPYAYRDLESDKIHTVSLATEEYDYPSHEWFVRPLALGKGYWSEPYYDDGGGNMLMTTYSMPVRDREDKIAAILTADISLEWLTNLMDYIQTYPNAYSMVESREGTIMVSTEGANTSVDHKEVLYFQAPVERTGWMLTIVIPEKDLMAAVRRVRVIVSLFQLLGIAMIIIIIRVVSRNEVKYKHLNMQKERIQSELRIGHDIQMALIPKKFLWRDEIDMVASIVPAKEVGGDLYDFSIRDDKLVFCIGDVSGKGVPAALVMAVTLSLFRSISSRESSPAKIVTFINDTLSENNDGDMFVTFFCGVLDLQTGQLSYCNAGHNPPLLLGESVSQLPVVSNISLGVMCNAKYQEQSIRLNYDDTLVLYTDGITEAENSKFEQFGEVRLMKTMQDKRDAKGHLEALQNAVSDFVGDASQSDDITMLIIHYLKKS